MKHKQIIRLGISLLAAMLFFTFPSGGLLENTSFAVLFLDVGQGDCALTLYDGQAMLIDGGEASQSSRVYAYLKAHRVTT